MVNDVTNDYVKEDSTSEEVKVFDLENEDDKKELREMMGNSSLYFSPELDKTYKIELTSTKVRPYEVEFEGEKKTKFALEIKATDSKGNVFEGLWGVGKMILDPIFKTYEKGVSWKVTKTGTGRDTRYNVVKDF